MKTHISCVHYGEKNQKCKECDFKCGAPGTLKTHIRTVHEGLFYKCEQCDKTYTHKKDLSDHVKVVHEGGGNRCVFYLFI